MTLIMALSLFSTLAIGMMPAYLSAKPQKLPGDGRSCSAEKETGLAILSTILGALLPMVVSILLGFVAAWRHDFGSKDASTLNRMVLQRNRTHSGDFDRGSKDADVSRENRAASNALAARRRRIQFCQAGSVKRYLNDCNN